MDIEAGLILYLKKVSQCIKNTTGIYSVGTKIMYYMYWVLKGSIDFYFPAVRLFLPTATPTPSPFSLPSPPVQNGHYPMFLGSVRFNSLVVEGAITASSRPDGDGRNNHRWFRDPSVLPQSRKNRLCSTLCVAPLRCPDPRAAAIKSTTTAPRVAPRHCRCRALGPVLLAALLQPSLRLSPAPAEEGKGRVPAAPRRCYTLCSSPQLQAAFPSVHAA